MSHAYHITNAVSDIQQSKNFYHEMFRVLGWKIKHEDEESLAYTDGQFDFWIVPAENKQASHDNEGTGFNHLAFRVKEKELVTTFYEWLLTTDAKIDIKPQAYPNYSESYYAVFFFDRDGTRLEVVYI